LVCLTEAGFIFCNKLMQTQLTHNAIWNNVKSLLFKHDCVIMPNFGGFVCNRENARIDQVSHLITPPAKKVMFNQNLKTNDGLLAQNIAQEIGITYSEALLAIDDLVNKVKATLENNKQLEVEQFGTFRLNADANYVFLPNKLNNYLHASFGLTPLQATPVIEMAQGSRKTRVFKDRKEIRQTNLSKTRKGLGKKILTVFVLGLIGINAYIFMAENSLIDSTKISTTGIHSWFDSLMAKDTAPTTNTTVEVVDSETAFIPEPPVKTEPEEVLPTTTDIDTTYTPLPANNQILNLSEVFAHTKLSPPNYYPTWFDTTAVTESALPEINLPVASPEIPVAEPATTVSSNSAKNYHVIGGVFCNEENARKFYNKLKAQGFEAELLLNPKINCNRVSYRKCATRQEAAALIDSLNNVEKSDIWILPVKE